MDIKEIKKEARRIAIRKNQPYRIYFLSKISPYLTYLFAKTSVTPNQVTLLGFLFVVTGTYFLSKSEPVQWVIGWLFLQIYLILDCSDGELARLKGMETRFGGFLDNFLHPISNALVIIGAGAGSYYVYDSVKILIMTSGTSALAITLSLIKSNILLYKEDVDIPTEKKRYPPLLMLIHNPGGFFHPLLLLALAEIVCPTIPFRIIYIPCLLIVGIFILAMRLMAFYRG